MGSLPVAAQVAAEVLGRRVAVDGVLGEQLERDRLERLGHRRPGCPQRRRALLDVLVGDRKGRVAYERRTTEEHLVEDDPECVEIAAWVDGTALGLLGGEVRGGSHHRSGLGQLGLVADHRRGNAEVGDLDVPVRGNEDVAGFDIAVDEAVAVSESECSGDVGGDLCGTVGMQCTLGAEDLGEAAALDILHDDEVGAPFLAPVVDAHDVGVVEVGGRLRLASEPLHEARVIGELVEEHLDGNRSIEQLVACQVHVGHPAAGDLAMEFITPAENRRALSGHRDGFYPPGRVALIAALPLR